MPQRLDRKELLRLARMGAQARLDALEREREAIFKSFPGIQKQSTRAAAAANDQPVRRRRRMSAAERKAVSARMKKRWAAWRKAHAK